MTRPRTASSTSLLILACCSLQACAPDIDDFGRSPELSPVGEELGRHIASEIDRAFGGALGMLEESLCQALLPFLGEQARMRAVSDLKDLLVQELQQAESPVLEIRAPAEFHEALSVLRDHAGVSLTATECETIEIVLVTERKRFEELSSRWLEVIQGRD